MDGALMEVGPYRLKDQDHLRYNDGAWDEFSNLLFIDNPVGTGFSYVNTDSFVHELTEMADQIVTFLTKFYEMFPEYETNDVSGTRARRASKAANGKARSTSLENLMQASTFPTLRRQYSIGTTRRQTVNRGIFQAF